MTTGLRFDQPTRSPPPAAERGVIWEDTLGKDFYDEDVAAWWRPCGLTDTAADNGTIDEYTGPLPYGLSWTGTFPDVVDRLGEPTSMSGGYGVALHADYADLGPYFIQIDLTVLHRYDDLGTAGIKDIYITENR